MSKEIKLTQKYNNIFHPLLLNLINSDKKIYAILPDSKLLTNDNKIENYNLVSSNNSNNTNNIIDSKDIFNSPSYFLLCSFNITKWEDAYQVINSLIESENNIDTINFIIDMILHVFFESIDDIETDKLIEFYKKYFLKYFKISIDYRKIFKIIRLFIEKELDNSLKKIKISANIHSNIKNNVLEIKI